MTFFITEITSDKIGIRALAEGPGGMIGDGIWDIMPGEFFLEFYFDELTNLGVGQHESVEQ